MNRADQPAAAPADAPGAHHRIGALDGLRGIAVTLVLVVHSINSGPHAGDDALTAAIVHASQIGTTGVDLFFALSGFLITGILLDSRDRPGWIRAFYARRILRIFPLYYAFLAIALVGGHVVAPQAPAQVWLEGNQGWFWTHLQNWLIASEGRWYFTPIGVLHSWSLAIEEQFYLVWPMTIAFLRGRALVAACVVLVGVSITCRATMFANGSEWLSLYVFTPARLDGLAIGAACAALVRSERVTKAGLQRVARLVFFAGGPLLLAAMLAFGVRGRWMIGGFAAIAVVSAAAVLLAAMPGAAPRLQRLLCARPLVMLGTYSYAIYLMHAPLMGWCGHRWDTNLAPRIGNGIGWQFVFFPLMVALSVAIAAVSWRFFESPILSLKRFIPTPRPPVVPAPVEPEEQRASA
ncbi:MAG TPA: acyltransferase [Planctomycetota bacterium]|nr:acyltransferase [Planctomycetota bacterium]